MLPIRTGCLFASKLKAIHAAIGPVLIRGILLGVKLNLADAKEHRFVLILSRLVGLVRRRARSRRFILILILRGGSSSGGSTTRCDTTQISKQPTTRRRGRKQRPGPGPAARRRGKRSENRTGRRRKRTENTSSRRRNRRCRRATEWVTCRCRRRFRRRWFRRRRRRRRFLIRFQNVGKVSLRSRSRLDVRSNAISQSLSFVSLTHARTTVSKKSENNNEHPRREKQTNIATHARTHLYLFNVFEIVLAPFPPTHDRTLCRPSRHPRRELRIQRAQRSSALRFAILRGVVRVVVVRS